MAAHLPKGMPSAIRRNALGTHTATSQSLQSPVLREDIREGAALPQSVYRTFWERENCGSRKQICDPKRSGVERGLSRKGRHLGTSISA